MRDNFNILTEIKRKEEIERLSISTRKHMYTREATAPLNVHQLGRYDRKLFNAGYHTIRHKGQGWETWFSVVVHVCVCAFFFSLKHKCSKICLWHKLISSKWVQTMIDFCCGTYIVARVFVVNQMCTVYVWCIVLWTWLTPLSLHCAMRSRCEPQ